MTISDEEKFENIKRLRREANKQFREKQKTSPAFIAMKEAQKKMRQKDYAYAKERAKKIRDAAKAVKKESATKINKEKQTAKDKELMLLVMSADQLAEAHIYNVMEESENKNP